LFSSLDLIVVVAALLFLAWVWVFFYKQPVPPELLHWLGSLNFLSQHAVRICAWK
jgi:hypothetical protein